MVKGTATGTATDIDGNYSLPNISSSTVLVFSFLGFQPQEVLVGDREIINIAMLSTVTKLDEFVVTALGVKRQKREMGSQLRK